MQVKTALQTEHDELEVKSAACGVWLPTAVRAGIAESDVTDLQMTAAGAGIKSHAKERPQMPMYGLAVVDDVNL